MGSKRTYILSVSETDGALIIEDVRTRVRARLPDFSKIDDQIKRWRAEERRLDTARAGEGKG